MTNTRTQAPPLPYTIKATLVEYRRRLGVWRIVLAIALTFIIYLRFGFTAWLISVAVIAVIIGGILWFLGRRSLIMTPGGIEYENCFGKRTKIAYSDIDGVKVFANYYETSFGVVPRISIGRKSGKSPLTLSGLYWQAAELDKVIAVLKDKKVEAEYYEDLVNYAMIAKQFPAYATYVERHPYKLATIIVIGILVLVTIFVLVVDL